MLTDQQYPHVHKYLLSNYYGHSDSFLKYHNSGRYNPIIDNDSKRPFYHR